jgi:hypothetical protein
MTSFAALVEVMAVLTIFGWLLSGRSESAKAVVRQSYRPWRIFFGSRLLLVSAPIWAVPLAIFGMALAVGRLASAWALVGVFAWGAIALPLAYRSPPSFAPPWLRDEFLDGRTALVTQSRWDRGCLWVASIGSLISAASFLLMIVVFHAAD